MKIKKPREHVDAKKRKRGYKKKYNNDFEETYETFKRAFNVKKGEVDSAPPKTMKFTKMLKRKKKRKGNFAKNRAEEFLQREHMKRLGNCKRRIN